MQEEKETTSTTLLRFTLRTHCAFALICVLVTATIAFFVVNYLDLQPLVLGVLNAALYALICSGTLRAFRARSPWFRAGLLFLGGFNALTAVRVGLEAEQVFLSGTSLSQGSVAAVVWFTSLSAIIFFFALATEPVSRKSAAAGASS